MGKRRPRRKGMRRGHLKQFSSTMVNTGRGPDKDAMKKMGVYLHAKSLANDTWRDRAPFRLKGKVEEREFHCILVKRNSERKLLMYFSGMEFFWVEEHPNDNYAKTSVLYWGRSSAMRAFDNNNILWAETYKLPDRST